MTTLFNPNDTPVQIGNGRTVGGRERVEVDEIDSRLQRSIERGLLLPVAEEPPAPPAPTRKAKAVKVVEDPTPETPVEDAPVEGSSGDESAQVADTMTSTDPKE